MRNYLVLTGFLIGLFFGIILVGRQISVAYEDSINRDLEAKILAIKAFEAENLKKAQDSRTANIILVGDIMLSRAVGKKMNSVNNFNFPFLKISDTLRGADFVFANLEGPISNGGKNQGSVYSFRADPKVIDGLVFANFGVLSLANNHIWDYGQSALLDTFKNLKNAGILYVGAGENSAKANELAIKEVRGNKIGFLAYTDLYPKSFEAGKNYPGISNFDLKNILNKISQAKASSTVDFLLVSLHWGDEYADVPTDKQKEIARQLIDAGADIIIGHHPHVVQQFESYKNGLIFYSLGNFVFDQNFSEETMSGYLVKIKLLDKKIKDWSISGTIINKDFQAELDGLVGGQDIAN